MREDGSLQKLVSKIEAITKEVSCTEFGEPTPELLVVLSEMKELAERLLDTIVGEVSSVSSALSERFVESGISSITVHGKTVYLAREYWPGPRILDLLPEGFDQFSPDNAAELARAKRLAKARLIEALKKSPEYRDIVQENYNAVMLRSALTGPSAPRDELGQPILPPELEGIVDLNGRVVVRVRSA